ncbi:hypothetical protein BGZ49_004816, partial [Haplosporangium sp. Z 27]
DDDSTSSSSTSHISTQLPLPSPESLISPLLDGQTRGTWEVLTRACINKFRGHGVDGIDNVTSVGMSDIETHLFKKVLTLIRRESLTELRTKDLFVALSGVLDLRSTSFKGLTVVVPELATKDKDIEKMCSQMFKYLKLGVRALVLNCDVDLGKIAKSELGGKDPPTQIPMLQLVRHLANIIDQGSLPVSEAEVVALWKTVLEILSCGRLKFLSGEHVCKATQVAKRIFLSEYHVESMTDQGRKVDLLLKIGDLEILNTEAKSNDNKSICDTQYKKNIRINHAIFREAGRQGIELPPMLPLDIRGMSAMVCCVRKTNDNIMVAGSAHLNLIKLPSSKEELIKFLCGSSPHILWQYVQLLLDYQEHVDGLVEMNRAHAVTAPLLYQMDSDSGDQEFESDEQESNQDQRENKSEPREDVSRVGRERRGVVWRDILQERRGGGRCHTPPQKSGTQLGDHTFFTPKSSKRKLDVAGFEAKFGKAQAPPSKKKSQKVLKVPKKSGGQNSE